MGKIQKNRIILSQRYSDTRFRWKNWKFTYKRCIHKRFEIEKENLDLYIKIRYTIMEFVIKEDVV